jgi:hypothetical protein
MAGSKRQQHCLSEGEACCNYSMQRALPPTNWCNSTSATAKTSLLDPKTAAVSYNDTPGKPVAAVMTGHRTVGWHDPH